MLSGFGKVHIAAGLGAAVHGNFKSEQELISNIIHHQAAFYAVDEIGTVLSKVENARKRGGAAYPRRPGRSAHVDLLQGFWEIFF